MSSLTYLRGVPSRERVKLSVDLAFSGAVYACLNAEEQLGLKVEPANANEFIKLGREIKKALGSRAHHGSHDCYGVIFFQEDRGSEGATDVAAHTGGTVVRQRNVTIFADGQLDRSPCGSGTSARVVLLHVQGRPGKLLHRSIIGSQFEAEIASEVTVGEEASPAYITQVRGEARLYGRMNFYIDPDEPLYPGFLL